MHLRSDTIQVSYGQLEKDFEERKVTTAELKDAAPDALNKLLDPIREVFDASQEWQEITALVYPSSIEWVESLSDAPVHPMLVFIAIGLPLENMITRVAFLHAW